VARGDPPIELDALVPYWRGVYYATIALEGRIAKLGTEQRPAVQEVHAFQAMAKRYQDALRETAELHRS
jgi:hypothetical protein